MIDFKIIIYIYIYIFSYWIQNAKLLLLNSHISYSEGVTSLQDVYNLYMILFLVHYSSKNYLLVHNLNKVNPQIQFNYFFSSLTNQPLEPRIALSYDSSIKYINFFNKLMRGWRIRIFPYLIIHFSHCHCC